MSNEGYRGWNKEIITLRDDVDAPYASLVISWDEGVELQTLIGNVWVDSSRRKQGTGSRLIELACARIKHINSYLRHKNKIHAVVHPGNTASRALFKRAGFTEMILMEKEV